MSGFLILASPHQESEFVQPTTYEGLNYYEILGRHLEPSTTYMVSVKSYSYWSGRFSDSSNEVEFITRKCLLLMQCAVYLLDAENTEAGVCQKSAVFGKSTHWSWGEGRKWPGREAIQLQINGSDCQGVDWSTREAPEHREQESGRQTGRRCWISKRYLEDHRSLNWYHWDEQTNTVFYTVAAGDSRLNDLSQVGSGEEEAGPDLPATPCS